MKNIRIAQVLAMVFSIGAISIAPQPAWAQTSETYSPVPKKLDYDIRYFIPNTLHAAGKSLAVDDKFLPEVPQPQSVLGFEVGEQYADWNDVLKYMEALQKHSDRVKIEVMGTTYQHRPIIQVTISSAENMKKLDHIKKEHLQLTNASISSKADVTQMPVVVNLAHSMHGNEASAVNSALATAYFFAASDFT